MAENRVDNEINKPSKRMFENTCLGLKNMS